jgi:trehalose synthase
MSYHQKLLLVLLLFTVSFTKVISKQYDNKDIAHIESQSMLYQSSVLSKKYCGTKDKWQQPYYHNNPLDAVKTAPVWFTSYNFSTMTCSDKTVLETIGSDELWDIFSDIGISAIYTGPIKLSGTSSSSQNSPATAGYNHISYNIDPQFGVYEDYKKMVSTLKKHNAVIIGDIIPSYTGKGYDFLLALKNYKDYPGIYHMVEIEEKHWDILPKVLSSDSLTLTSPQLYQLKQKGYIIGEIDNVSLNISSNASTNWDVTGIIEGVDGKKRRWIYLHYISSNQPTLNWLDPNSSANRLISGDVMQSLNLLDNKILRIDTTPFFGMTSTPQSSCYNNHIFAKYSSNLISMLARQFNGFTYHDINTSIDEMKDLSSYGTDLSYDFFTKTALIHAILSHDTSYLRLVSNVLLQSDLQPLQFIHGMQTQDEISLSLKPLEKKENKIIEYNNKKILGKNLIEKIKKEITSPLIASDYIAFNRKGLCTTMASICASSLGIKDIYSMSIEEKKRVQACHLLLTFFNAMQPGVFAISGWDMVGALPLPPPDLTSLDNINDTIWSHRGAYDLMGDADKSSFDIPPAPTLYGNIVDQLKDPTSFVSELKKILKVRKIYNLYQAELLAIPRVKNKQAYIALYRLPSTGNIQMTALNFGLDPIEEEIIYDELKDTIAINLLKTQSEAKVSSSKKFTVTIDGLEGKVILFRPTQSHLKRKTKRQR